MKKYKLNITPFLNTQLEPQKSEVGNLYPLYYRIVYQRKSTMLKSISGLYYQEISEPGVQQTIAREILGIEGLVQYLTEMYTEPLELIGFKEKYLKAQQSVRQVLDTMIRSKIRRGLEKVSNPIKVVLHIGEFHNSYPLNLLIEGLEKILSRKELELVISEADMEITTYHFLEKAHELAFGDKKVIEFLNATQIDKQFLCRLNEHFSPEQSIHMYEYLIDLLTTYLTHSI